MEAVEGKSQFVEIELGKIREPEHPIRKFFDLGRLNELAASLKGRGALQPIVVRTLGDDGFELIIGSRRLRAARRLQQKRIHAMVLSDVNDRDALILGLVENLQRHDLTPFEEARAILRLVQEHRMNEKAVAAAMGKGEHFIRTRLQLLDLPPEVQELVADGHLGLAQVQIVQRARDPKAQIVIAREAVTHRLSSRDLATLTKGRTRPSQRGQQHLDHFDATKFTLRVEDFTRFVRAMEKHTNRIPKKDREKVARTLCHLSATALTIAKRLAKPADA